MIRKAFVMSVNVGCEEEYKRRHSPIWPELEETLKKHGVHNYSIFLLPETRQLFAYVEIESEERWASIANTEVCRRWWQSMAPLMPSDSTGRPLGTDLAEMFYLP